MEYFKNDFNLKIETSNIIYTRKKCRVPFFKNNRK